MTRAPAEIGDDAFGLFENRSPIRVGHFSDQNAALFELAEFARAPNSTRFRRRDGIANTQTRQQTFAFFFQPISRKRAGFFQCLHRLRSGLKNKNLTCIAVFRPLDVHGLLVMLFDGASPFCQAQNFIVPECE